MRIGITMGDCAGVGPEITLKALEAESVKRQKVKFIIYGDRKVYEDINERFNILNGSLDRYEFVDMDLVKLPIKFGTVQEPYGLAAGRYIQKAIEDALDKKIDAVVTSPIHKKAFQLGGYGKKYAGHTEMFADLSKTKSYTMMLAYKNLRVLHVSIHVSLRKAIDMVTKENVFNTIKLGYETCKRLKIKNIRIGVAGLNPHAGDHGLFGKEELEEIEPAIEKANKELKCTVEGPVPSDTLFSKALGGMYDIVISLYHDQGHIPLKTLGFKYNHDEKDWYEVGGINVTLGLPIIRTSVDHGTAFGKAGKGRANADSMVDAIHYAMLLA